MYVVMYAHKKGSPGALAVGTRRRKSAPFEDKNEADKHADWLKLLGSVQVNVVEENK